MKAVTRVLAAVPRWAYWPLRKFRTVALVAVEPFDKLHRRLTGRAKLPPLWLRRHVGPVAAYERAPGEIAAIIAVLKLVRPTSRVLDLGCGSGAMAFEFARFLGPTGRYTGFDVHEPSLKWARRQFKRDPRFTFELARVETPYSAKYKGVATQYRFPVATHTLDFALAKSLFTHLLEPEARHYLAELARVLTRDGRALVTAFLPRDEDETSIAGARYEFPYGGPDVWNMVEAKPTAVVAYRRDFFVAMLEGAGLEAVEIIEGDWRGGGVVAPNAQDVVIVRRARPDVGLRALST